MAKCCQCEVLDFEPSFIIFCGDLSKTRSDDIQKY